MANGVHQLFSYKTKETDDLIFVGAPRAYNVSFKSKLRRSQSFVLSLKLHVIDRVTSEDIFLTLTSPDNQRIKATWEHDKA